MANTPILGYCGIANTPGYWGIAIPIPILIPSFRRVQYFYGVLGGVLGGIAPYWGYLRRRRFFFTVSPYKDHTTIFLLYHHTRITPPQESQMDVKEMTEQYKANNKGHTTNQHEIVIITAIVIINSNISPFR